MAGERMKQSDKKAMEENKTTTELLAETRKNNLTAMFLSGLSIGINLITILIKTLRLLGYI